MRALGVRELGSAARALQVYREATVDSEKKATALGLRYFASRIRGVELASAEAPPLCLPVEMKQPSQVLSTLPIKG